MLRKIIGIDLAYAKIVSSSQGFRHWPCFVFRSFVADDNDQVLDMITALHQPPALDDSPEEIARNTQQNARITHALEHNGCRVIPAPAKKTPELNADGRCILKRSDDQMLMIELALVCMKLRPDFLTLVAGDGDFAPLVAGLRREGIRTEVVADLDNLASSLRRVAYSVIDVREMFANPEFSAAASGIEAA